MASSSSNLFLNPVLASLDVRPTDRIISIKECHGGNNCDSNFILTHLIKHSLMGGTKDCGNLCLVVMHNNVGHYQNVAKKLGYDLHKFIENGSVKVIEMLKDVVEDIDLSGGDFEDTAGLEGAIRFFNPDKELVVRMLFSRIRKSVEELSRDREKEVCLIIDDLSHLGDLGIDLNHILSFVNYCLNLVKTQIVDDKINNPTNSVRRLIINNHVCGKSDEIISNYLNYVSDINVQVSPLKTGFSSEVTGLMVVERRTAPSDIQSPHKESNQSRKFHFKAYDKGIKTFHLGESVYNFYK